MGNARYKARNSSRTVIGGLLCAALVLAWATAIVPARAGDDDGSSDESFDTKLIRQFLEGIGLEHEHPAIDYRERSPLVLPKTDDLPPPESQTAVDNNPAWPVDPDVKAAREASAKSSARQPIIGDSVQNDARVLRPDELAKGWLPRSRQHNERTDVSGNPLSPSKLGYKGNLFGGLFSKGDETAKFTKEPARTSLTDPPPGYQTPSPDQPYGVTKDTGYSKPKDYQTTHVEAPR